MVSLAGRLPALAGPLEQRDRGEPVAPLVRTLAGLKCLLIHDDLPGGYDAEAPVRSMRIELITSPALSAAMTSVPSSVRPKTV